MTFTEARLERAVIELLGEQGYPHLSGAAIEREPQDVLIRQDLRDYLAARFRPDGITAAEIDSVIRALDVLPASDLYDANRAVMKRVADGFRQRPAARGVRAQERDPPRGDPARRVRAAHRPLPPGHPGAPEVQRAVRHQRRRQHQDGLAVRPLRVLLRLAQDQRRRAGRRGGHRLAALDDPRPVRPAPAAAGRPPLRVLPRRLEARGQDRAALPAVLRGDEAVREHPAPPPSARRRQGRHLLRGHRLRQELHDAVPVAAPDAERRARQPHDRADHRPHRPGRPARRAVRHGQGLHRRRRHRQRREPCGAARAPAGQAQRRRLPDHDPQVHRGHGAADRARQRHLHLRRGAPQPDQPRPEGRRHRSGRQAQLRLREVPARLPAERDLRRLHRHAGRRDARRLRRGGRCLHHDRIGQGRHHGAHRLRGPRREGGARQRQARGDRAVLRRRRRRGGQRVPGREEQAHDLPHGRHPRRPGPARVPRRRFRRALRDAGRRGRDAEGQGDVRLQPSRDRLGALPGGRRAAPGLGAEPRPCDEGAELTVAERRQLEPIAKLMMVMTRGKDDEKALYDLLGTKDERKKVDAQFKNAKSNLKIAIVVDMWLTGFDVPFLDTIYIDKPLQKHSLIQTISRVNRKFEGKDKGLVVDYVGIKRQMNLALAQYSKGERENVEDVKQSIVAVKDHLALLGTLFHRFDTRPYFGGEALAQLACLNGAAEFVQRTQKTEKRFMALVKRLKAAYDICAGTDALSDAERDRVHFHLAVRSIVFKLTRGDAPDTAQMNARVRDMISEALRSDGVEEILRIGDERASETDLFDDDYLAKIERIKLPNTRIKLLQRLLAKAIEDFRKVNRARGIDFSRRFAALVDKYNERDEGMVLVSGVLDEFSDRMVDLIMELREEHGSHDDLGIDLEEKAFHDILLSLARKYDFQYPEDKLIALARAVKALVDDKARYTDWSRRDDIKAELKVDLILLLAEHGYPPVDRDEVYKEIFEQAENFKKYRER